MQYNKVSSNTNTVSYKKVDNSVFTEFRTHIKEQLSPNRARWTGCIISRYIHAAISSALHGNTINISRGTTIRFVKIPMADLHKHIGYKFKSQLTSDWIFMIHISGSIISKFRYRYYPSKSLKKQVQNFIDSSEVYKMIRT
jgi:hypothetical protein